MIIFTSPPLQMFLDVQRKLQIDDIAPLILTSLKISKSQGIERKAKLLGDTKGNTQYSAVQCSTVKYTTVRYSTVARG